jgi:hypothetical protein
VHEAARWAPSGLKLRAVGTVIILDQPTAPKACETCNCA